MMNKNEMIIQTDALTELKNTQDLCALLMKTPHYAKMGQEGIFAIVASAKSLNMNPIQALMGGMYYVKGKVEMSSRTMGALIRSRSHSFTKDAKSDDKICILHGRRADTKDCWTESFSIEEAQKAGLVKQYSPWVTYPRDMLYARALSRLARQLFPDVIGNCYVQGEIGEDTNINEAPSQNEVIKEKETDILPDKRTQEEIKTLIDLLDQLPQYRTEIERFLIAHDIHEFEKMSKEIYEKILRRAAEKIQDLHIEGA